MDKGSTHARRTHGPPCQPWKLHTRPTSKINRASWLNVISLLVSATHFFHCTQLALYCFESLCIFAYLPVSLCIFLCLYVSVCIFFSDVSLRIFTCLSNPFRKIRTYLYVSLCIFQNRSGRYVRIFTLYVSLCIFSTGFERYIKIRKDT